MKTRLILFAFAFFLMASGFSNGLLSAQSDDKEAERLIDKASYHYGVLEEYPGALKFLNKALLTAGSDALKAQASVKIAYVYSLMGYKAAQYRHLIEKALILDPGLELKRLYYNASFRKAFNTIKQDPSSTSKAESPPIDTSSYSPAKKKKKGRAAPRITLSKGRKIKYKKFFASVETNYLMTSNASYSDTYGSGQLVPRFRFGYYVGRSIYFWAAYAAMSADGAIPDSTFEAKSNQSFSFIGAGFIGKLTTKLNYKMECGMMFTKIKEEALGLIFEGSSIGFSAGTGIIFNFSSSLFVELNTGYTFGSVSATEFGREIRFGGLLTGIGLGFRF